MLGMRLGVKGRIYGGFAVLVALGLVLALFAVWQLSSIKTSVDRLSGISGNNTRMLEVQREVEVLQRATLRFKYDGDETALKSGADAAAKAADLLRQAEANASEARRNTYGGLRTALETYEKKRETLIATIKQIQAAQKKLFSVGDEVTAVTDKLVAATRSGADAVVVRSASGVETAVLLVRVANWRFQATLDPKGPATFKTNLEKANAAIAAFDKASVIDEERALLPPVKAALASYAAGFGDYATNSLKSNELFQDDMAPQMADMLKTIGSVQSDLSKTFGGVKQDTDSTISGTVSMQELIAVIALLLGAAIAYVVGAAIVRPVVGMTSAMSKLASGDVAAEIPSRERSDEIGAMAKAVDVFKQNAIERRRLEAERKDVEAKGAAARKADMSKLAAEFQAAVGNIIDAVSSASTELEAAASTLTGTAETTQRLSSTVAAASEEASANVNSVASATEELTSSVNEIARQVKESSKIAGEAVQQANLTDSRIGDLSQAAARIGDVIKLITSVAEQTNLLALNATIEAARAGEAGRGFAVVAQEVKALAAQTAKATDEISTQIAGMQTATEESVAAIKEIGGTIARMSEIAAAIAAAVEQQGAATQEISRSVQKAARGTADVAGNINSVNRGASETGSASSQVLASAQSLSSESNHLKVEVDKFLMTVRAA